MLSLWRTTKTARPSIMILTWRTPSHVTTTPTEFPKEEERLSTLKRLAQLKPTTENKQRDTELLQTLITVTLEEMSARTNC